MLNEFYTLWAGSLILIGEDKTMRFVSRFAAGTLAILLTAGVTSSAQVNKSFSKQGKHGGKASGSVVQRGNVINANGTATGPKGKTVSGQGTAKFGKGKVTANGSVTGPKGKTATGSGTATYGNGAVNANGTATGPNGKTGSGSMTATQGSATVTGGQGKSHTFTSKGQRKGRKR